MIGVNGNGRDDGGKREDVSLSYFPYFHFLFLSFSPSFLFIYFFEK